MHINDLQTPCILLDADRLEKNVRSMQAKANREGVDLRPHVKTHKSAKLARMQVDAGAVGITVAKVGEAEVFAANGFDNIRIAYTTIGREKWERIAALYKTAKVTFCVDSREAAQGASDFFGSVGEVAPVLIEVDAGYGRCGVVWDDPESLEFAKWVSELPGLAVEGILTHAGHAYAGPSDGKSAKETLRMHAVDERDRMIAFAKNLESVGVAAQTISIGSTPTISQFENASEGRKVTEIRPGNYIFNDAIQVGLGAAKWTDCSLTVLATVVSIKTQSNGSQKIFLDAGKKILTTDTGAMTDGYGTLLYNPRTMTPLPHARITGLSEEHGWVYVRGGSTLEIGDRVQIVPNHACVVAGNQSEMFLVNDSEVSDKVAVDAVNRSD